MAQTFAQIIASDPHYNPAIGADQPGFTNPNYKPPAQAATPVATQTNTATNGSGTGTGSGNAADINATYDLGKTFYSGLLNQVAPQQQADTNNVNSLYGAQQKAIQDQRDAAYANLDQQSNVANQSYNRSLTQLGNSIRNQYQGGNNQLGTQGAGDSSAASMLGYALGQDQNTQRGYMNQDLNNQLTSVAQTRDADTNQFKDQNDQNNAMWQTQLTGIAKTYASLVNQINTELVNNEQARQNALRYAGQWAQGQAAQLDTNLQNALGQAAGNFQGPNTQLTPLASYTAHNVVVPTTQASANLSQPVATQSAPLQIYDPYKQNNSL